jgi:lathosterol oxidase
VRNEILRSLGTCALFALTTAMAHQLLLAGVFRIRWSRPAWQIALELVGLILLNELHVYVLHRLMHTRWLLRNVHVVHHRSHSPTAYSVYSVHWIEGILMSLVTPIAMLVHNFQIESIAIFPVVTLVMNVLCHWNHDLFPNVSPNRWLAMAQRHGLHHTNAHGNFGFTMALFDRLGGTLIRSPSRR